MEPSFLNKLPFGDAAWDEVLEAWLHDTLDRPTRARIVERLSVDGKFREEFSEWVKGLRPLGSASAAHREGRSS